MLFHYHHDCWLSHVGLIIRVRMGNIFSLCYHLPNFLNIPLDAVTGKHTFTTLLFLHEIQRRIAVHDPKRKLELNKIIHNQDLVLITPIEKSQFVQDNVNFLVDPTFGEHHTNTLIQCIINNCYEFGISMHPNGWSRVIDNILHAANLSCGKTKLLQLCFLAHLSKLPNSTSDFKNLSKHIEVVDISVLEDSINSFCKAAMLNPTVKKLIPAAGFVPPKIIAFRFGRVSTDANYRGYVLNGNFVAVEDVLLRNYDPIHDPCRAMYANNVCFHLFMHAANRQYHDTSNILSTPDRPDLIPSNLIAVEGERLEAGRAGELALWGILPDWNDAVYEDEAEALAVKLMSQYAGSKDEDRALILSPHQKQILAESLGIDVSMIGYGGMIASKVPRTFM